MYCSAVKRIFTPWSCWLDFLIISLVYWARTATAGIKLKVKLKTFKCQTSNQWTGNGPLWRTETKKFTYFKMFVIKFSCTPALLGNLGFSPLPCRGDVSSDTHWTCSPLSTTEIIAFSCVAHLTHVLLQAIFIKARPKKTNIIPGFHSNNFILQWAAFFFLPLQMLAVFEQLDFISGMQPVCQQPLTRTIA